VIVGIEGPPDKRSAADREQAAKNQIFALKRFCGGMRRMTLENERGMGEAAELFDYTCAAELYSSKFGRHGRQPLIYRRFASAAQAIRFAMEDLPPRFLKSSYLEVDETRFQSAEIRQLYTSMHYPFARMAADPLA
jgi:hypothetical protein